VVILVHCIRSGLTVCDKLIKDFVQGHCAVPPNGGWRRWGHDLLGIADVAIEHVVDHAIDVDACFVVVLFAINFPGDADGLFASVRDGGDAVSFKDFGKAGYICLGLFTSLEWSAVY
jgi:hypothetical protein